MAEQDGVLAQAAEFVRPGGVLTYATCSLLPPENEERVAVFLTAHPAFRPLPMREVWRDALPDAGPPENALGETFLLLTPRRTETDGFFVASLRRDA